MQIKGTHKIQAFFGWIWLSLYLGGMIYPCFSGDYENGVGVSMVGGIIAIFWLLQWIGKDDDGSLDAMGGGILLLIVCVIILAIIGAIRFTGFGPM